MIARGHVLALLLPLAVTGVVIAGSAANRSSARGPTVLTEREVRAGFRTEDRTIGELWLTWSEPAGPRGGWLSADAVRSLGFDTTVAPADAEADVHYRKQLHRRAFVVFELDGPAYAAAAAERAEDARRAPPPDAMERVPILESRLVPVAVHRDAATVTAQFPDPRTHLIVSASVGIRRFETVAGVPYIGGVVFAVQPRRIQVPPELAARLPPQDRRGLTAPFSVSVLYGRRWAPWVADIMPAAVSR